MSRENEQGPTAKVEAEDEPFEGEVVFLNPFTCGVYKDGGKRYKVDRETGLRTEQIDNELGEHVARFVDGEDAPGLIRASLEDVFSKQVLVPRYYDERWLDGLRRLVDREGLGTTSLGELEDEGVIAVRGGHGSPSQDNRSGDIPYIKVSDIRSLRINVNPTNLVTETVARTFWPGEDSGLEAWDLITPNRASSNIGEFAVLLPGEERVVITKEVFVIRVVGEKEGFDPFYLLWALCLKAVRDQWQRVTLMQTNREDVGGRHREILIPEPRDAEWAETVSAPFRNYFTAIAESREKFAATVSESGYEYIASALSAGSAVAEEQEQEEQPG